MPNTEHPPNGKVSCTERLGLPDLAALLGGDVFFVPCEWGTKKPLVTYVERPFEGTKSPAYRALFEVQEVNVAIHGNFALICDEQLRNSRLERLN